MSASDAFRAPYRGVPSGTTLNGIYAIDRMIGAGGMGEVYLGHELQTNATVAIKMLTPDMAENEAALALFRREAAALLNLHHDAIIRYFLFTVEPVLQRPYLAMEYIDGRSLSDVLDAGALSYDAVVGLVRRVAGGFHVAHERGIVHRDVSPDNIIVPGAGVTRAKIIDFGIARSTAVGDPTIIGDGFAGKQNYVSPEQIGLFGHHVTYKSDIYSLGLVLYHAITGQKLDMGGTQFQLVEKRRQVPNLAAVDERLRPLLERMLQPDPAERPYSMAEIAAWPLPQGDDATIVTPSARVTRATTGMHSPARSSAPSPRKWPTAAIAGVAALVVLGGGGYALYGVLAPDERKPAVAPPKLSPSAALQKTEPLASTQPSSSPPQQEATRPSDKQAALPNALTPGPAPPPAGRVDRVRSYLDQYSGGDCFLVVPVAISQSAAIVEGFGASPGQFDAFAKSFRETAGFGASLGVRQVAQPQCPAIAFVNDLRGDRVRAPRITLDATELKNGEVLSGTVENFESRAVELLLVTDNGQVQNITGLLKPGVDSKSFTIGLQRTQTQASPQLLIAVASQRPLDAMRTPQPVAADIYFPQALRSARDANLPLAAGVRFFKLEH